MIGVIFMARVRAMSWNSDRFRQNPESVDAATQAYFATWSPPAKSAAPAAPEYPLEKIVGAVKSTIYVKPKRKDTKMLGW